MKPVKLIVSHKGNLQWKYGKAFPKIISLVKKLQDADKKKGLDTKLVLIDDATSAQRAGVKKIKIWSEQECKRIVDDLYKKHIPAYIVILGAQDIFPFQDIENPAEDDDSVVPSDLPYACDTPFSRKIENFIGPTRVVGRIPDIPGQQTDIAYLERLITNAIEQKPIAEEKYHNYFAVTALVWKKSTELSLQSMFGEHAKMISSPNGSTTQSGYKPYSKKQLEPLTHFYNCHGANIDLSYYGQKGNSFPEALQVSNLSANVKKGAIVAAECCYGAQLFDHVQMGLPSYSIANTYLANNAIAFLGSSTIAYGPADSQGLADLITQYFIKNILKGASTGRALLEARQKFLSESGPDLDPCELKTVAQFYLLGDPSIQPAECEDAEVKKLSVGSTIMNSRKNLFIKGKNLEGTIGVTKKQRVESPIRVKMPLGNNKSLSVEDILEKNKFTRGDKKAVYSVKPKNAVTSIVEKKLGGQNVKFHAYIQDKKEANIYKMRVLIVKENASQILGWRVYESR